MVRADEVIAFLHRFEQLAEQEDFALVAPLIDAQAVFRYSDGDFVGREAIRGAFEKSWRGDPSVRRACFHLSDITVLHTDERSASATYLWHWEGAQGDQRFAITGRGTRVLRRDDEAGGLVIVHEHLSRLPRPQ